MGKSLILAEELYGLHKLKALKVKFKLAFAYRHLIGQMSQSEELIASVMDTFNGMVEEEFTRRWKLVRVRAFIEQGYIQTMQEKHDMALDSFRAAMAHYERLP